MIDERIIEQIIDRADIVDVISEYVELKKKGINYQACCPFHQEKTPSFVVNPARGILMLGGTPENKFSEYLKVAKVKEISGITCGGEAVEHILETYSYLIGEERKVIELANEAGDDATADLMTGYLKEQEKMVWMLVAFSTKSCAK